MSKDAQTGFNPSFKRLLRYDKNSGLENVGDAKDHASNAGTSQYIPPPQITQNKFKTLNKEASKILEPAFPLEYGGHGSRLSF